MGGEVYYGEWLRGECADIYIKQFKQVLNQSTCQS